MTTAITVRNNAYPAHVTIAGKDKPDQVIITESNSEQPFYLEAGDSITVKELQPGDAEFPKELLGEQPADPPAASSPPRRSAPADSSPSKGSEG